MNRCPLCSHELQHESMCPIEYVERLRTFFPSHELTRSLLLLGAGSLRDWNSLKATYQNHSGETLAELQFFAEMAANIFTSIQEAISDTIRAQQMKSLTTGATTQDRQPAPSSLILAEQLGALAALTGGESPAPSSSEPEARRRSRHQKSEPMEAAEQAKQHQQHKDYLSLQQGD